MGRARSRQVALPRPAPDALAAGPPPEPHAGRAAPLRAVRPHRRAAPAHPMPRGGRAAQRQRPAPLRARRLSGAPGRRPPRTGKRAGRQERRLPRPPRRARRGLLARVRARARPARPRRRLRLRAGRRRRRVLQAHLLPADRVRRRGRPRRDQVRPHRVPREVRARLPTVPAALGRAARTRAPRRTRRLGTALERERVQVVGGPVRGLRTARAAGVAAGAGGGVNLSVDVVTSLDAVADEWDELAADRSLYLDRRWLRSLERDPALEARYVLVRAGWLLGALPEEAGASVVEFPFLTRRGLLELAPAIDRFGPRLLHSAGTRLEVRWDSFDGYLRSLGTQRRHRTRAELRRFEASGLTTERRRLGECYEELAPLSANVQRRYGHSDSPESTAAQLRSQAAEIDEESVVFLARRDGRAVGFSLAYEHAGDLVIRTVGFDYEHVGGGDAAYFNRGFYLPIRFAAEAGLRAIECGPASYRAKVYRGCAPYPLFSVVRPAPAHRDALARG